MPESKKQKSNDLSFLNDYDQRVHGSVGFDDGIDQTSGHPISNPPVSYTHLTLPTILRV